MTQPPHPTNDSHHRAETRYSLFDRTGPFTALTALIRQHAENPEIQPALDRESAAQLAVMVAEGSAPALLAALATTTGEILNEWFDGDPPRETLLAGLQATTAQPGWSPAPESALTAARDIVADYVSAPRLPDADISRFSAAEPITDTDMLNAGLMMCLELLHSGRHACQTRNS